MSIKLTRNEFEILVSALEKEKSLPLANLSYQKLRNLGCLDKMGNITQIGKTVLKPYRVKRAIFFAAGFGSRLLPITINTPKPLVRVDGVRIIDTLIDAVLQAGIEEIIIVCGYLSEQFDQLKDKYPMIKFVENPFYRKANNIFSAICVKDLR